MMTDVVYTIELRAGRAASITTNDKVKKLVEKAARKLHKDMAKLLDSKVAVCAYADDFFKGHEDITS